ncbi:MAG TPA: hypothetical protein VHZ54_02125 [Solirubrobacterales bacterium]|jgi:hypothetical protein|nr:hypothetical protein [Solirubrobacterales bacterium]
MSGREADQRVRVRIDGSLTDAQLEIVGQIVLSALIGCAGDLDALHKLPDPRWAVREVAALARLLFWLEYEEVHIPDRNARRVMLRLAREVDGMNQAAETTGGDPEAEHEAIWAFVALLSVEVPGGLVAIDRGAGGAQ